MNVTIECELREYPRADALQKRIEVLLLDQGLNGFVVIKTNEVED